MTDRKPPRPVPRGAAGTPQSRRSDPPDSANGLGRSSGVLDVPGPLDPLDETQDIAPERLREMARKSLLDLDRSLSARKETQEVDWDAEPTKVTTSPLADADALIADEPSPPREPRAVLPRPNRPAPSHDAPRPAAASHGDGDVPKLARPRPRSKTLVGVGAFMGPSGVGTSPVVPPSPPEPPAAAPPPPPPPPPPPLDELAPPVDVPSGGEADAGSPRESVPRRVLPPLAASPVRPDAARAEAPPAPMPDGAGVAEPFTGFPATAPEAPVEPEVPTSPRQSPPSMKPAMAPRVQVPAPLALDGRFEGREDTGPSRQKARAAPSRPGLSRLGLVIAVALPLGAGVAAGLLFFRPAVHQSSEVAPPGVASAAAILAPSAEGAAAVASHAPSPPPAPADEPATDDEGGEGEGAQAEGAETEEAPAPAADDSLLGRVRQGDAAAVEQLQAKPEMDRTVEESVALAQGRIAAKRKAFAELDESLRKHPDELADKITTVRDFIEDRDTAIAALQLLAELPGELSADVIYDVWVGTRGRNDTTWLAEQLCHTEAVRSKASMALQVALALRSTEECEPIRDLLPQVAEHGDQRSSRLVAKLLKRRGCGDRGRKDCFKCLRPLDRDRKAIGVRTALAHVRSRRAPHVR